MSSASLPLSSVGPRLSRIVRLAIASRMLQVTALLWIAINAIVLLVARRSLAVARPLLEGQSLVEQVVAANIAMIEVLALIALVVWLTRNRVHRSVSLALDPGPNPKRETLVLLAWGTLAILGGVALGQALATAPLGFHLAGTLFGAHDHNVVTPNVALAWAAYNLAAYAVVPYLWVRGRDRRMPLRSLCRRGDIRLILVVVAIEAVMQLSAVSSALLDLGTRQLLIGAPATFALYLAGTVLPTTIFIQALLVPRFLALTGSVPATVVLGGVAYTAVHASDSWMVMTGPESAVVSVGFLVLTYFGPGMIKTLITVRTGNAWVHAWAYHAFAPHVLVDTPLIVRIFGI